MFVCVCNGITERQVREAIDQGACSLQDLTACLGVASGCGTCAEFTVRLLDQTRESTEQSLPCAA
mgnify:CR=1 FL=1